MKRPTTRFSTKRTARRTKARELPLAEAAGGPEDTGFLFTKFIDKAREYKRFGHADSVRPHLLLPLTSLRSTRPSC